MYIDVYGDPLCALVGRADFDALQIDHAVLADGLFRHRLDQNLRMTGFEEMLGHHAQVGSGTGLFDQYVWQQNRKGLVADDRTRTADRMTKTERLPLTHHGDLQARRYGIAQYFEQLMLAAALELGFELVVHVKVIFDGALAGVGNPERL